MRLISIVAALTLVSGAVSAAEPAVPEELVNALRICNAHATGHESRHPNVHDEWHLGYAVCAKIDPAVRKMLQPTLDAQVREQALKDREALGKALKILEATP